MENVKDLMYYSSNLEETEENKKLYKTTHGFSDPGEQKVRNYNWRNVDLNSHSFGKTQEMERDGVKKSLMSDYFQGNLPKTIIVDKKLEDFRQATEDMLGKTKYKGTLNENIPHDFVFGIKSIKKNENNWNLAKCMYGDKTKKIETDKDLGKSIVYKSKLSTIQPKDFNNEIVYGTPSVRKDLPKKKNISVSDVTV